MGGGGGEVKLARGTVGFGHFGRVGGENLTWRGWGSRQYFRKYFIIITKGY